MSAAFWDRIADKYAARPVQDQAAYDDWVASARRHLTAEMDALELGCGTGTTALKLAPGLRQITSTDIAPAMVAIAERKRVAEAVDNVKFAVADTASAPAGPFDAVMAFNLIHLLTDPQAGLAEMARRVKPGGLFLSKTGLLGDAPFWLGPVIGLMRLFGKAPPVSRFNGDKLKAWLREAGFEIVEEKTYPGIAPTLFIVARKL